MTSFTFPKKTFIYPRQIFNDFFSLSHRKVYLFPIPPQKNYFTNDDTSSTKFNIFCLGVTLSDGVTRGGPPSTRRHWKYVLYVAVRFVDAT